MNTRSHPDNNKLNTPKITKVKIIIDQDNEINSEPEESQLPSNERAKILNYFLQTPERLIPNLETSASQVGSKKDEKTIEPYNKVFNISKTNNKDGNIFP
jgi:hypothetical protein